MQYFKPADPTRRTPTWLQRNTKENMIWQLAMLPVVLTAMWLWNKWADRRFEKELKAQQTEPFID